MIDPNITIPALDAVLPSPAERRAAGKELRATQTRRSHAQWEATPERRDPVDVLIETAATRLPELVPLRNARMLASPFAFFRGAARPMAYDLATTPSPGIHVQLCGDAHLSNFGVFASPERRLLFDLNDFDETWPGPFEWDIKRLAASVVLAARANGASDDAARLTTVRCVAAYRHWIAQYAALTHLEVWYANLDADRLRDLMSESDRRAVTKSLEKASRKDHLRALNRLTSEVNGRRFILPDPPIVTRVDDEPLVAEQLPMIIDAYRQSLQSDRRSLFDRYRLLDVARKVVGVGSVGTRCFIALFQGPSGGPLFLQIKEAGVAAPQAAGIAGPDWHAGERVVHGQRMLQSASDVLLGWTTAPITGIEYYVRQLWDAKGSAVIEGMNPSMLTTYTEACGWALARAHARTADSCTIAGYLGNADTFDEAIAEFAIRYADQTVLDHAAWAQAAADGRIEVADTV